MFTYLRKLNIMFVFLSLFQNISIQTKFQSSIYLKSLSLYGLAWNFLKFHKVPKFRFL